MSPTPPDPASSPPEAATPSAEALALEQRLRERSLALVDLRMLWEKRDRPSWRAHPGLYEALADDLRRRGEVFWCFDVAGEGLELTGPSVRLRQLQALALADSGAPRAARRLLESLLRVEGTDSETLGLLARTHKDMARAAPSADDARTHLEKARHYYETAFQLYNDTYPGINAAALAFLAGDRGTAQALARKVEALCVAEARGKEPDVWSVATRAEAALIAGELAAASELYREAVDLAGQDLNVIASMRRQALLLAEHVGPDARDAIADCFRVPPVVVFSGHRIDDEGRATPRFQESDADAAKERIGAILDRSAIRIGFSSAASGGDILFAESLLERGAEVHLVLPMAREAFRKSSVIVSDACDWGRRFEAVMNRAASVTYASTQAYAHDARLFDYTNDLIFGLALQRSRNLGADLMGIAVWDGLPGAGPGSTADAVATWERFDCPFEIVPPRPVPPSLRTDVTPAGSTPPAAASGDSIDSFEGAPPFAQQIKAILFADVVGFSQLTDGELPAYMTQFMAGVGRIVDALPRPPAARNTWGDAFHFVFDEVRDAGTLAIRLRDFVQETDWLEHGLARPLGIRIALHAGCVFAFDDPVTRRPNFLGYHVNRTARIEPIAEEGQIYASEPFAALAAFQAPDLFECDYAGQKPLAKGFGSDRIFVVRPVERGTSG